METKETFQFISKIIVIGDSSVGKTNIVSRFTDDKFDANSLATVGVNFKQKTIVSGENKVKLQVWDTAGEERFKSVINVYFRGAKAAFCVFDVTNRKSFDSCEEWIYMLREQGEPDIVIVLVGNKTDLASDRQVSTEEGALKATKNECAYIETSAKIGDNIEAAFELAVRKVIEQHQSEDANESSLMDDMDKSLHLKLAPKQEKKSGCCDI